MLTLFFVDSELETIPEEMWKDDAVTQLSKKRKKKPGNLLLDSSLLHRSIDAYFPSSSKRRGRPDIFHILLNVLNSSIINILGELSVFIHTRNDILIKVNPETRIPKSYNRFAGLMEQLFELGEIRSSEDVLFSTEKKSAIESIKSYGSGKVTVMWPSGEHVSRNNLVEARDQTFVIGGFTSGDYISDLSHIGRRVSIFDQELTIWTVAGEIIAAYETYVGL